MSQRIIHLGLVSALALAGCTRSAATRPAADNQNANLVNLPPPGAAPLTASGANANASNLNANAGPVLPVAVPNASAITETDDAVITSTTDYSGNRIETRVFKAHPRLNKIIIITARNRTQQGRVYGNRGEVRELPAALFKSALTLSGEELADAVGIAMNRAAPKVPVVVPASTPVPTPAKIKAQNNNLPPANP